ncbi:MAG: 30S ribosomal protein S7 [Candidatus Delongbacteria bacterium]|nr:30S ribosomal protein S7 [Candidatus Delongbacteria bacterium]
MARRKRAQRREILPDPVFNDLLVAKFVNYIMRSGKKSTAEQIMYDAIEALAKKTGKNGLEILHKSVDNVKPLIEVKSRRVGGATYQVPVEVRPDRKLAMALRWIIGASKSSKGRSMADRLANELLLAFKGEGASIKKREDTHRMAEANKAFAHYRW